MSIANAGLLFDLQFEARVCAHARQSSLTARPEMAGDSVFLADLHAACSPLRNLASVSILNHQARMQADSFERTYPKAMRRIGLLDGEPVGRFVVNWMDGAAHGVDIAVLEGARLSPLAMCWLRSWIVVADALGRACTLSVRNDNPAILIYRRLGFQTTETGDGLQPFSTMRRPIATRGLASDSPVREDCRVRPDNQIGA